jgi:hypothetical protein
MKANQIQKNLIEKFILVQFVEGALNSQEAVNQMLDLISKKLNMSLNESRDFLHNALNK